MRRARGFTLLEVLLATTLLAILLALLFSTLEVGGRLWSRTEERMEPLLGYWTLERFLRSALSRAKLWTVEGETFGLEGKRHRLVFVSTLPYAVALKGPQRFEIYRQGKELRVQIRSLWGEEEGPSEVVLLDGVKEVQFRYFGRDSLEEEGSWHESWSRDALPHLVEVTVARETGPSWPPIVVEIHSSLEAASGPRRILPNRPLLTP